MVAVVMGLKGGLGPHNKQSEDEDRRHRRHTGAGTEISICIYIYVYSPKPIKRSRIGTRNDSASLPLRRKPRKFIYRQDFPPARYVTTINRHGTTNSRVS